MSAEILTLLFATAYGLWWLERAVIGSRWFKEFMWKHGKSHEPYTPDTLYQKSKQDWIKDKTKQAKDKTRLYK